MEPRARQIFSRPSTGRGRTVAAVIVGAFAASALLAGCAQTPASSSSDPQDSGAGTDLVGRWGSASDRETHVVFSDDGTLGGNDGCNRFGGDYTVEDGIVQISPLTMTAKGCIGPVQWLTKATSAVVDGDELVLSDETGAEIGTLPRTSD